MKKFLILIIVLLFLVLGLIGFTLFTRIYTVQPGEYYCDATENGMMTSYAVYKILPGGKLEDEIAAAQGKWRSNSLAHTVTFSGEVSLEKSVYDKKSNSYRVTIQPAFEETYRSMQFMFIENLTLQCYLAYPLDELGE